MVGELYGEEYEQLCREIKTALGGKTND